MSKVKIVCISDTHARQHDVSLPKGDILLHAGDFTRKGSKVDTVDFLRWFDAQYFAHKAFCAGNHDFYPEQNPEKFRILCDENLSDNCHYLQDSSVELMGLKIYGSPWQPEFFGWSFNLPRGKALADKWDMIPSDTDILITHGPPLGFGDFTEYDQKHVGCVDLFDAVVGRVCPKIHLFGHIHEGYSHCLSNGKTHFVNASICTLQYNPTNAPIVVELEV